MGLFASSQVINDGTSDRTFDFRAQIPNPKSIVGEYIESANTADQSTLTAKHELGSSRVQRSVLQHRILADVDTEGTTEPITVNLSVAYDKRHSTTDVSLAILVVAKGVQVTGVILKFLQRFI